MDRINNIFKKYFTPKQIQAMKDAWRYGSFGDSEERFGDDTEYSWALIACTNDIYKGKNFSGRQISGIISGISQLITKTNAKNIVKICPDWWGDGAGDTIAFNIDALGFDNSDEAWNAFNEWSKVKE